MLRTDYWKFQKNIFALNLGFSPSGPSEQMIKESASHHIFWEKPPTTPRAQSLWILCASTRDLWILGWFCGFIWVRGGVFWSLSSLQNVTFLIELWWSGKLPEHPWSQLGSSWIISGIFEFFTWNTLRSPQRGVRSTLLSSCYLWISICVDNAPLALYFYRNMTLICNRREPITAFSIIVRQISLAVVYTR